jgi:hypothetical protein
MRQAINSKELESLKKQSLHHVTLSPNTKTNIVSTDLMKLSASNKKPFRKKIAALVFRINP